MPIAVRLVSLDGAACDFERIADAERTVEPAALGHRVGVRADQDRLRGAWARGRARCRPGPWTASRPAPASLPTSQRRASMSFADSATRSTPV